MCDFLQAAWNPDGLGIRPIDPSFAAFAREKKMQFYRNCLTSSLLVLCSLIMLVNYTIQQLPTVSEIGTAVGVTLIGMLAAVVAGMVA
jgi:hypothetical protein